MLTKLPVNSQFEYNLEFSLQTVQNDTTIQWIIKEFICLQTQTYLNDINQKMYELWYTYSHR